MDIKKHVQLIAEGLQIGEDTGFQECPVCQVSHEKKFSVTRIDTGLLYNCFRASCGASGFVGTGWWEAQEGEKPVRPKRRPYTRPLHPLTQEDKDFFLKTWGTIPYGVRLTDHGEYAFPISAPNDYRKGWVIRQPIWKGRESPRAGDPSRPKALTYKNEPDYSRLGWELKQRGRLETCIKHVVLVEDAISAKKVTQSTLEGTVGVALNGANMGYQEVAEIGKRALLSVTVFLDPDATNQAFAIQRKWGLSFNFCRVVTAEADPKDLAPSLLKEMLQVDW